MDRITALMANKREQKAPYSFNETTGLVSPPNRGSSGIYWLVPQFVRGVIVRVVFAELLPRSLRRNDIWTSPVRAMQEFEDYLRDVKVTTFQRYFEGLFAGNDALRQRVARKLCYMRYDPRSEWVGRRVGVRSEPRPTVTESTIDELIESAGDPYALYCMAFGPRVAGRTRYPEGSSDGLITFVNRFNESFLTLCGATTTTHTWGLNPVPIDGHPDPVAPRLVQELLTAIVSILDAMCHGLLGSISEVSAERENVVRMRRDTFMRDGVVTLALFRALGCDVRMTFRRPEMVRRDPTMYFWVRTYQFRFGPEPVNDPNAMIFALDEQDEGGDDFIMMPPEPEPAAAPIPTIVRPRRILQEQPRESVLFVEDVLSPVEQQPVGGPEEAVRLMSQRNVGEPDVFSRLMSQRQGGVREEERTRLAEVDIFAGLERQDSKRQREEEIDHRLRQIVRGERHRLGPELPTFHMRVFEEQNPLTRTAIVRVVVNTPQMILGELVPQGSASETLRWMTDLANRRAVGRRAVFYERWRLADGQYVKLSGRLVGDDAEDVIASRYGNETNMQTPHDDELVMFGRAPITSIPTARTRAFAYFEDEESIVLRHYLQQPEDRPIIYKLEYDDAGVPRADRVQLDHDDDPWWQVGTGIVASASRSDATVAGDLATALGSQPFMSFDTDL